MVCTLELGSADGQRCRRCCQQSEVKHLFLSKSYGNGGRAFGLKELLVYSPGKREAKTQSKRGLLAEQDRKQENDQTDHSIGTHPPSGSQCILFTEKRTESFISPLGVCCQGPQLNKNDSLIPGRDLR